MKILVNKNFIETLKISLEGFVQHSNYSAYLPFFTSENTLMNMKKYFKNIHIKTINQINYS